MKNVTLERNENGTGEELLGYSSILLLVETLELRVEKGKMEVICNSFVTSSKEEKVFSTLSLEDVMDDLRNGWLTMKEAN